MSDFNPYAQLGVSVTATIKEIRQAFRRLVKRAHPDGGGDSASFAALVRACNVLSDPASRARYDQTGEAEPPQPSNLDCHALEEISRALGALVSSERDLVEMDVMSDLARHFVLLKKDAEDRQNRLNIRKNRASYLRVMVTCYKEENNLLEGIMNHHIEKIDRGIDILNEEVKKYERAIEILNEYGE